MYVWLPSRNEMKEHLPLILPYLNLKWRQCELAIEILSIIKTKYNYKGLFGQARKEIYTWEEFMILETCCKECKILNKKGK